MFNTYVSRDKTVDIIARHGNGISNLNSNSNSNVNQFHIYLAFQTSVIDRIYDKKGLI